LPDPKRLAEPGLDGAGSGRLRAGLLGSGRYLPFEGTGVISNWQLDMPKKHNPPGDRTSFLDALTGVVIPMYCTAAPGTTS
jgi:hypothetical protein